MRLRILWILAVLLIAPAAFAGTFSLNDWCFYVNSLDINHACNTNTQSDNFLPPIAPGTFDYSHLADNGLGTVVVTLGAGTYNVFAFWDYTIQGGAPANLNEYATTVGSLALGQSYSVDAGADPSAGGQVVPYTNGYLLLNQFEAGTLDNTNHLSACGAPPCEDVAVTLGYNIVVDDHYRATLQFVVTSAPPISGFYIQQSDISGGPPLFFSESLTITHNPEPATIMMMTGGFGLLLIGLRRRRRA